MKVYEVYGMLAKGELIDGTKIIIMDRFEYVVLNNEIYDNVERKPLSGLDFALNYYFMNEKAKIILPKEEKIQVTLCPVDDLFKLKADLIKGGYEVKSIRKVYDYEND